jgi:hypothetical protein
VFPLRYFTARYWAERYWPKAADEEDHVVTARPLRVPTRGRLAVPVRREMKP